MNVQPNNRQFVLPVMLVYFVLFQTCCKKLVTVNAPTTSITSADVYTTDATAAAVLTGIYTNMSSGSLSFLQGIPSINFIAALSADEFTLYDITNTPDVYYYRNDLSAPAAGFETWNNIYPVIYICNAAIEGLQNNSTLTVAVDQQLLGEAKFMRAFCYFYLVNLYGKVPLALTSDYAVNASLSNSSITQVYQQIIADLKDAEGLLVNGYVDGTIITPTMERTRPNKWAAASLLSRVYLYNGDYPDAITLSDSVIGNTVTYSLVSDLDSVFLANSTEAIWQLQPVNTGYNTQEAMLYILPATGPNTYSYPVYLSSFLMNAFELGDQRRTDWTDSVIAGGVTYYYPYKYKVNTLNARVTEYEMIFRLSEQYLIRAEAEAEQNDPGDAAQDLNIIRNRAGLPNTTAANKTDLLAAIIHERQVELFTEWGHRWLDLKRTGNIDAVMGVVTPQKGGTWNTYQQLYPVPLTDLKTDPNLSQNVGY
jgi:hypothetical protein